MFPLSKHFKQRGLKARRSADMPRRALAQVRELPRVTVVVSMIVAVLAATIGFAALGVKNAAKVDAMPLTPQVLTDVGGWNTATPPPPGSTQNNQTYYQQVVKGTVPTPDLNTFYSTTWSKQYDLDNNIADSGISTVDTSNAQLTNLFKTSSGSLSGPELNGVAVDGGGNGTRTPGFYRILSSTRLCPTSTFGLSWYPAGMQAGSYAQVLCVPTSNYYTSNTAMPSPGGQAQFGQIDAFDNAVVNQGSGELYFGPTIGSCLPSTANFEIYNPGTNTAYYSGVPKPATPADDLWNQPAGTNQGPGYACSSSGTSPGDQSLIAPGSVSRGMVLDANGNMYVIIRGTNVDIAANNPINTTGQTIAGGQSSLAQNGNIGPVNFLVRIVPSRSTGTWTYSVVKMLTVDPSLTIGSADWGNAARDMGNADFAGNIDVRLSHKPLGGMVVHNGLLYTVTDESGASDKLDVIDPTTGYSHRVGTTCVTYVIPAQSGCGPVSGLGYTHQGLTSVQTLDSVQGNVYNDVGFKGVYSTASPPLAGVTLGLYAQGGGTSYSQPTLISTTTSRSDGLYTFALPASAGTTYYVRPVSSTYVQTFGGVTVTTGINDGLTNPATMYCATGATNAIAGKTNPGNLVANSAGPLVSGQCYGGAQAIPYTDPTLGTSGATADPATFGSYAKVTQNTAGTTVNVDFGMVADSAIATWLSSYTVDTKLHTPGTADSATITVTAKNALQQPATGDASLFYANYTSPHGAVLTPASPNNSFTESTSTPGTYTGKVADTTAETLPVMLNAASPDDKNTQTAIPLAASGNGNAYFGANVVAAEKFATTTAPNLADTVANISTFVNSSGNAVNNVVGGTVFYYSVQVTNAAPAVVNPALQTLTSPVVTDPDYPAGFAGNQFNGTGTWGAWACKDQTLAPGASTFCVASYTPSSADTNTVLYNTASVTMSAPDGSTLKGYTQQTDPGASTPGNVVTGTVFADLNKDGTYEASQGEFPIAGTPAYLYNGAGTIVARTTTNANGEYGFAQCTASVTTNCATLGTAYTVGWPRINGVYNTFTKQVALSATDMNPATTSLPKPIYGSAANSAGSTPVFTPTSTARFVANAGYFADASVSVNNTFTGRMGNTGQSVTYNVTILNAVGAQLPAGTQITYTMATLPSVSDAVAPSTTSGTLAVGAGGLVTFKLAQGQVLTMTNLAVHYSIAVLQDSGGIPYQTSYTDTQDGWSGIVDGQPVYPSHSGNGFSAPSSITNTARNISFTNQLDSIPISGIDDSPSPVSLAALGLGSVGVAGSLGANVVLKRRRRSVAKL